MLYAAQMDLTAIHTGELDRAGNPWSCREPYSLMRDYGTHLEYLQTHLYFSGQSLAEESSCSMRRKWTSQKPQWGSTGARNTFVSDARGIEIYKDDIGPRGQDVIRRRGMLYLNDLSGIVSKSHGSSLGAPYHRIVQVRGRASVSESLFRLEYSYPEGPSTQCLRTLVPKPCP